MFEEIYNQRGINAFQDRMFRVRPEGYKWQVFGMQRSRYTSDPTVLIEDIHDVDDDISVVLRILSL